MGNPITPVYDPSKLNEAQRDGLACITCGSDDQPMKPVDHLDGVQLFECAEHSMPYWQSEPCPSWCAEIHQGKDEESDRIHTSPWAITSATTMSSENFGRGSSTPSWVAHTAEASLQQGYREAEPRILFMDAANDRYQQYLTLEEAERHAEHLLTLIRQARGDNWSPLVLPFDHAGRCDDSACRSCYPVSDVA